MRDPIHPNRPALLLSDVNQTLLDLAPPCCACCAQLDHAGPARYLDAAFSVEAVRLRRP